MFCPGCGKEVVEGQAFCQHCGAGLTEPGAVTPPAETSQRSKTGWEDRETSGFFNGLFQTLKEVLFNPTRLFRKMPVKGGMTDPLLFALIIGMVGLTFQYFWQTLLEGVTQNFIPPGMTPPGGQQAFQHISVAFFALLSPFIIIIGLFCSSGVLHLFLLLVKGARAGFEATFRVVAYSYSALLFSVVPICGSLIGCVWIIVITIIGLREMHGIGGGKAAFAVFAPVLLCCGFIVIIATLIFMGAMAASVGTMMQMYK